MKLFGGTVPPPKKLFGGTVPPPKKLFGGTIPPNNFFGGGTIPPNNFFGGGTLMEISFWYGKGDIPNENFRLPPLEVHFGVGGCGRTDSAGVYFSFLDFYLN